MTPTPPRNWWRVSEKFVAAVTTSASGPRLMASVAPVTMSALVPRLCTSSHSTGCKPSVAAGVITKSLLVYDGS
jgi:hypothetical protein